MGKVRGKKGCLLLQPSGQVLCMLFVRMTPLQNKSATNTILASLINNFHCKQISKLKPKFPGTCGPQHYKNRSKANNESHTKTPLVKFPLRAPMTER